MRKRRERERKKERICACLLALSSCLYVCMHIKTQIAFAVRNTLCVLMTCVMVVMTMGMKRNHHDSMMIIVPLCCCSGLQETVTTDKSTGTSAVIAVDKAAKGV